MPSHATEGVEAVEEKPWFRRRKLTSTPLSPVRAVIMRKIAESVPLLDVAFGSRSSGTPDHPVPATEKIEPELRSQIGSAIRSGADGFQKAYSLVRSPSGRSNSSETNAAPPAGTVVVVVDVVDVVDVEVVEVDELVVENVVDAELVVASEVVVVGVPLSPKV